MNPYLIFLLYLLAIVGFACVVLLANRWLGPRTKSNSHKLEPFECGVSQEITVNVKAVSIKYYGVAILFILFDLETMFLFIWALGAREMTGFLLFTLLFFVFLLVLTLIYVYKARLLEAVTE